MREILAATIDLLGADFGNVQIYDGEKRVLRIAVHRGFKKPFLDFFREVSAKENAACGRALRTGKRIVIEDVQKDTAFKPFRRIARGAGYRAVQSTPLMGTDGKPLGMMSTHFRQPHRPAPLELAWLDLYAQTAVSFIERCRVETKLRESEDRLSALVQASSDVVYRMSADWKEMRHLSSNRFLPPTVKPSRRWLAKYIPPEDQPKLMAGIRKAIREKSVFELEHRVRLADGSVGWTLSRAVPIVDAEGRILEWFGMASDVTECKNAEIKVRNSVHQLRTLSHVVEQSPVSVLITNEDGSIDYVNPKFTEVTGYALGEVMGKNPRLLKSGQHPPEFYREMWGTLTTGRVWRGTICNRKKNGKLFPAYAVIAPVVGSDGKLRHYVGIQEDITEQHQAIGLLRDREERLRAILNTVGDAVITIDREGIMLGVNPAALQMFGYTEGEMQGRNVRMLMPGPFRDEHGEYLANYRRTGERKIIGARRELQAKRKDGTTFPIELAVSEATHLNIFTGVIRDLTERKRLEAEVLQISEDERQRVAADLHDGICQELVSINFAATALERDVQLFNWQLAARVKKLAQTIVEAAGHTREVARAMNPVVAGGDGLMNALRHFTATIAETYRVRCHFRCPKPIMVEDRVMADQLYRIVQEAVQNAIQHGKAKEINVRLHASRGALCVVVADNGRGMSTSARSANGLGLRAMNYRARLIGGQLSVQPRKGGGTEVTCRIPQTEESP